MLWIVLKTINQNERTTNKHQCVGLQGFSETIVVRKMRLAGHCHGASHTYTLKKDTGQKRLQIQPDVWGLKMTGDGAGGII